jgi:hypothetical protein
MTTISTPIFENAEEWLETQITGGYIATDDIAAVYPSGKYDEDFGCFFIDNEEGTAKYCDFERHVKALELLVKLVATKQLFVGGITNPVDLTDTGNWDVEVSDAFFQLVYHGEVIYG